MNATELVPIAGPKPIMRLGKDDYKGLHRRYDGILKLSAEEKGTDEENTDFSSVEAGFMRLASPSDQNEIRKKAKEWASVLTDPETRNMAEEAAEILLQQGFELPELKAKRIRKRVFANYDAEANTINVNIHPDIQKLGGMRTYNKKMVERKWASQDNVILHELSHYIDFVINPDYHSKEHSYRVFMDKKYVTDNLSEYAFTDRSEFEAELIAGILRGKVYPDKILDYAVFPKLDDERAKHILALGNGTIPNDSGLPREFDKMAETVYKNPEKDATELLADNGVRQFIERQKLVFDNAVDVAIREVPLDDISVQRLKESSYVFSGIKTFHELNEAFPSLLDEDGNRKPFERFLNDVQKVNQTYNGRYLRTEYNFAHASALMAARWKKFEKDGDKYHLQYRTMGDKRVRRTHRMMDGITLPVSSPFWDKYFPPNNWGCRCSAVQVLKGKYPMSDEREAMNLGSQATAGKYQEMFMFNPGKRMTCFPAYNGYTIRKCNSCDWRPDKMKLAADIPDNELCRACRLLQEQNSHYTVIPTKVGKLRIHDGHGKHERDENIRIGTYLAEKHGYEIDLLDNPQGRKTADSYNHTLEIEQEYKLASTPTVNAIDRLIRDGRKQADNIVLWLDVDMPLGDIRNAVMSRIKRAENVKTLTIVINGKDMVYTREQMLDNGWEIKQADFK